MYIVKTIEFSSGYEITTLFKDKRCLNNSFFQRVNCHRMISYKYYDILQCYDGDLTSDLRKLTCMCYIFIL